METLLWLAHTEDDGSLGKPALEALGAARSLAAGSGGAPLVAGLVGGGVRRAADAVASSGAVRILGVEGSDFAAARYASDAAAAEAVTRRSEATIVVAPATARWRRTLPGVAARIGGRADGHVTAIRAEGGSPAVTRWFYRQRMEGVLRRVQRPWVILVDPGCHAAFEAAPGSATVETITPDLPETSRRTTVAGVETPAADQQTIRPEAETLFVAGAGWTKKQADGNPHVKEAEALILEFLRRSGASLGGSKSLVDQSGEGEAVLTFMTHLHQVGQTGSTPRHPKGLATCCHGEEPHVVGWRFINERRAVNIDPNCGWSRGKADVLYVADAFEVMAKVNALLAAKKEGS